MSFRTVLRWIQRGDLKAFQLPGRGDNRILIEDFVAFLRQNNIPLPPEFAFGPPRILIVEDDPAVSRTLKVILEGHEFEARVAPDGFTAGAVATEFQPQVMTVDLRMPGLGGHDFIRLVRARPPFAAIKILVVSGLDQLELDRAIAAGADAALHKPVDSGALIKAIETLIGAREPTGRSS